MKGTVHTVTIAVLVPARAGTAHDGLAQEGLGEKNWKRISAQSSLTRTPFPSISHPGRRDRSKNLIEELAYLYSRFIPPHLLPVLFRHKVTCVMNNESDFDK